MQVVSKERRKIQFPLFISSYFILKSLFKLFQNNMKRTFMTFLQFSFFYMKWVFRSVSEIPTDLSNCNIAIAIYFKNEFSVSGHQNSCCDVVNCKGGE